MYTSKSLGPCIISKQRFANEAFIEALYALPDDLLPEYWFELEPNPKSKRIYLREDKDRYIKQTLEWGTFGYFNHRAFELAVKGLLPEKPVSDGAGYHQDFYIHPRKPNTAKSYDLTDTFRVFEHFLPRMDCYFAYAATSAECLNLNGLRAEHTKSNWEKDDLWEYLDQHLAMGGNYADAKLTFPGLVWRSVISEEMADDYALDLEALKELSVRTRVIPAPGTAGDLFDLQFADHPEDWERYQSKKLLPHVYAADEHRSMIRFLRETIIPQHWHSTQHWDKWLYQGEFAWPK